jgi:uroporphyrinogen-III synthase
VFTSRNAVEAFFDVLSASGKDARALGDAKVAAIGPQTAVALARVGIRVDFMPDVHVNEAVAEGLAGRTAAGDRILLYRAQEARDVLPERLRDAGRLVDVVAGYKTHLVDDPNLGATAAGADIVTFTSSSTVRGFVHNVADAPALLANKTVAAIGPITAATARAFGIRVDVVAEEFTVEGLLRALEAGVTA